MEGFLLGFASSVLAACAIWMVGVTRTRWKMKSLEGFWIEAITGHDIGGPEGRVLVSKFFYNHAQRSYAYKGTSYVSGAVAEWQWITLALYIDQKEQVVYYVYKAWRYNTGRDEHYGFGLLRFQEDGSSKKLGFTTGLFRGSLDNHVLHYRRAYRAQDVARRLRLKGGRLRDEKYQRYIVSMFQKSNEGSFYPKATSQDV